MNLALIMKEVTKERFFLYWFYILIMKNYFDQLPSKDKEYYSSILRIIGIDRMVNMPVQKKEYKGLSSEEMF